jgi:hypothetical protein
MTTKSSPPEFAKVLVLSTGHLGSALATGTNPLMNSLASMTGEHGWLMWTGPDGSGGDRLPAGTHEPAAMRVLRDLLRYARKRGCRYVLFDADGPTLKQFPTYDW